MVSEPEEWHAFALQLEEVQSLKDIFATFQL